MCSTTFLRSAPIDARPRRRPSPLSPSASGGLVTGNWSKGRSFFPCVFFFRGGRCPALSSLPLSLPLSLSPSLPPLSLPLSLPLSPFSPYAPSFPFRILPPSSPSVSPFLHTVLSPLFFPRHLRADAAMAAVPDFDDLLGDLNDAITGIEDVRRGQARTRSTKDAARSRSTNAKHEGRSSTSRQDEHDERALLGRCSRRPRSWPFCSLSHGACSSDPAPTCFARVARLPSSPSIYLLDSFSLVPPFPSLLAPSLLRPSPPSLACPRPCSLVMLITVLGEWGG